MRSQKETPTSVNFAVHSGNKLLYSLSLYQDYSTEEIVEMINQLTLKPNANKLDLENNVLIHDVCQYIQKNISTYSLKHLVTLFYSFHKLNF